MENQEYFREEFEVSKQANLIVKNISGQVNISTNSSNKIDVKAIKYFNNGDAENTTVNIWQEKNGTVHAETEYHKSGFLFKMRPVKVEYEISIPAECNIDAKTVNGNITLKDAKGIININTVNGNISATNLDSPILELRTVNGTINGESCSGNGTIKSVNGKIQLSDCKFSDLRISTVNGKLSVSTSIVEGLYSLKTVSGSINLIVPQTTPFSVYAKAVSGSYKTNHTPSYSSSLRRRWEVDYNGGGPQVKMKTVSGSFKVLTEENAKGYSLKSFSNSENNSTVDQMGILTKLQNGELNVEEALSELN